ncbi:MAG: hypothetical protein M0Q02_02255 [Candidatus Muirbacterium halophilum]|nr:hypothetical protein [Candidatus Muirbacterium halophilum]
MANIKRWTVEEEQFLRKSFEVIPNTELSKKFGVTVIAIQRKLSRLGCVRQKQKKWNNEEEEFLRKNFMKINDEELSVYFDVTSISIRRKLHRLGLSRLQEKKRLIKKANVKKNIISRINRKKQKKKKEYVDIYRTNKEYQIFQKIYHEIWRKEGTVKEIINSGSMKMMLVDFEDIGEKKLVMGLLD